MRKKLSLLALGLFLLILFTVYSTFIVEGCIPCERKGKQSLCHQANYQNLLSQAFLQIPDHLLVEEELEAFTRVLAHSSLSKKEQSELLRTFLFVLKRAQGSDDERVVKIPCLLHSLRMGNHMLSLGQLEDKSALQAGLLYGVLLYQLSSFEELEKTFDPAVLNLLKEVPQDGDSRAYARVVLHAPQKSAAGATFLLAAHYEHLRKKLLLPFQSFSIPDLMGDIIYTEDLLARLPFLSVPLRDGMEELLLQVKERLHS